MKDKLLEVLARLTGKSLKELQENLLKPDSEDFTDDFDSQIESMVNLKIKSVSENQLKRGHREKAEEIERLIKGKFGIEEGLVGEQLIDKVYEISQEKKNVEPSELDEAKIKAHPVFQDAINNLKASHKEALGKVQSDFDNYKNGIETDKFVTFLHSQAERVLNESKANLGDKPEVIAKRLKFFTSGLDPKHFKAEGEGENRKIIVLGPDGNPKQDANFNDISFEDYIKDLNPYGFHEHDPGKSGGGAPKGANGGGGTAEFAHLTTKADAQAWINKNRDQVAKDGKSAEFRKYFESLEN